MGTNINGILTAAEDIAVMIAAVRTNGLVAYGVGEVTRVIEKTCVPKEKYHQLMLDGNKWKLTLAALYLDGKLDNVRGSEAFKLSSDLAGEFVDLSRRVLATQEQYCAAEEDNRSLRLANSELLRTIAKYEAASKDCDALKDCDAPMFTMKQTPEVPR